VREHTGYELFDMIEWNSPLALVLNPS